MLFFPTLTIKAIISIAQTILIFSLLIYTNEAGVIKKRDLTEIESTTVSTRLLQNEADFKERKETPTILTALSNESATTKLKLQPVSSNFGFEISKEFTNNEILLNEALKQQELKSSNQNRTSIVANGIEITTEDNFENSQENEENYKLSSTNEIKLKREENKPETSTLLSSTTEIKSELKPKSDEKISVSSTQGITVKNEDKVQNNINEKLEVLNPLITTTEFSSNAIKEEKIQKNVEEETERKLDNTRLTDRFKQLEISVDETTAKKVEEHDHLESFDNSLNVREGKPRPPSQILTELKLETEASTLKYENDIKIKTIQNSKDINDHLEDQLMQETTEAKQFVITEVPVDLKANRDQKEQLTTSESTDINTHNVNETLILNATLKPREQYKADIFSRDSVNNQNPNEFNKTSAVTTIKPNIEETLSSSQDSIKPLTISLNATSISSHEEHLNTIQDGLDREVLLTSIKSENISQTPTESAEVTTLFPLNEENSTFLDGNKMEYARSMFKENEDDELNKREKSTTLPARTDNEILITTTPKTVVLNIKEGLKDTAKEDMEENLRESNNESFTTYESIKSDLTDTAKDYLKSNLRESIEESSTESALEILNENVKGILKESAQDIVSDRIGDKELNDLRPFVNEKKPKFINDNSTNAQQMNLPNNAEVWYLASMKSLPKANVTIDTAQKHNNSNDLKEDHFENHTFSLNTNSEKNLLDWSLIMQNKDLATTARNQNLENEDEEEDTGNQLTNEEKVTSTTDEVLEKGKFSEIADTTTTKSPKQSVTQPSIQSREDMTNIKPLIEQEVMENTTIMANSTILSYTTDSTEKDKDITTMNKHKKTLTSLTEFENTTTKPQSTLNNKPSLDIEPNLNEINLTSNQTQPNVNDELKTTTTTAGNPSNIDVNVAVAATTTERELVTSTESTAGSNNNDMTTLEQNSIDLTTLSSLVSSKQNASQNNAVVIEQQQNNNVISEESKQNELEKTAKETGDVSQRNKFENIELVNEITTTTTEIPITTFRPTNLAINSTTTSIPPPSFRQEVDQNGNEQKQSITALEGNRNNSKTIETHLSELETIETTTTTLEIIKPSKKPLVEENTTSSSKDDEIINEQIQKLNETTTTTQTTPKLEEDITTIGSSVSETTFAEEQEIETTTATPKTPVVIEKQGVTVNESSTIKTSTEEDKIKSLTKKEPENEQDTGEKVTEKPVDAFIDNETATMGTYSVNTTTTKENEETLIKLLDDTTTTTSTTTESVSSTTTTLAPPITAFSTTTTIPPSSSSTTTSPSPITTKIEEIYKVIHTTTTEAIQTTTSQVLTEITDEESSFASNIIPIKTTRSSTKMIETADIGKSLPTLTSVMAGNSGNMYPKNTDGSGETDVNVIIAITVSVIGVVALILLVGFLYIMRKRQKQTSFSNRCRPVSLDEYTIDNGSVGGSIRKSSALRSSKRTYGNLAFDDPSLRHNAMGVHELAKFVQEKLRIFEEFRDVPQITSRLDEVPQGCEDKNRYANVLPLPETRVILQRLNDDDKTEYINANYVTGPKDPPNYYIACQAPLDTTVEDFWRMIWEQQSRVIIQATDLIENGVEKCAEYLPPSVTLDNHCTFGDFQITLQNREVKDKYAISTIVLKHVAENATRELTHYWYKWPEVGVPAEEAPIIAMLLEARSSLISYAIEQANEDKEKSSTATLKSAEEGTANGTSPSKDSNVSSTNDSNGEINGNISMVHIKKTARNQGPLTIHCSPGTGRTGTIIACDIAIRSLETPKRTVDIPQIVFYVRRGRASAVLTKEQYEFIYKVANMYAAKISNPTNYN